MKYINVEFNVNGESNEVMMEQMSKNAYQNLVEKKKGKMTGWLRCDSIVSEAEKKQIKKIAEEVRKNADVLVVIGIGGSYLGAKAGIDFLSNYYKKENDLEVIFVGNSLSEKYLIDTLEYVNNKNFYINVISKSGGTLEPAVAFRLFRDLAEKKYGKDAKKHIIATTSKTTGALKKMSNEAGYRTFIIPDDVGGRYSVLSAVGLFPLAAAGFDIDKILEGAKVTKKEIDNDKYNTNLALKYAAVRNLLYKRGKEIEVYSSFNPNMRQFLEWMKQLFGESECKNNTGIFPASLILTMDLHSMGQLMQQGKRNIFETFINAENENVKKHISVEKDSKDYDNLNYICNKNINELNHVAMLGTKNAHIDGDVPVVDITYKNQNELCLGSLFFFFEFACGISAYMLGVDPFNQPGVEAYKKNIKTLLNK